MKILVDLDGVVFNFVESLKLYLVDVLGEDPARLGKTTSWNFFADNWGYTFDEFNRFCNDGVDAGYVFRQGPTWEGAVEGVHALHHRGHSVHFVTDRSFGTKSPQNTIDWLGDHALEYDSITFSADKTLIHGDLFIEDRDKNYISIEQAGNATPVLLTRPWNEDLVGARRVETWPEFISFVDRWQALNG